MFRQPYLNTHQKVYMSPQLWNGGEKLGGGLGTWGRVAPVGGGEGLIVCL